MLAIGRSGNLNSELGEELSCCTVEAECEETTEEKGKDPISAKSFRPTHCLICGAGPWALNQLLKELLGQSFGSGTGMEGEHIKVSRPGKFEFQNP